ncbi:hypothetical protein D7V64_15840 [Acinetobacter cumulans]|uniref:Uncharacterized protein n=1 Tax=Acinetobacter cumulans TaxID=2136182 RepID=A0A3A8G324_9GAMM|nr:hypothetical protein D7V64_15840 [Acinetobacter cumulans]
MDLGILRLGDLLFFTYDEVIQEQEVPKHKTIIIGFSTRTWGRTAVYLAAKHEKPRHVGVFYYQIFVILNLNLGFKAYIEINKATLSLTSIQEIDRFDIHF